MHIYSSEALGVALRTARRRKGLTQQQLAETVPVSRDWVNRLERGNAPRAELHLVLRALLAVGLTVNLEEGVVLPDLESIIWQDQVNLP